MTKLEPVKMAKTNPFLIPPEAKQNLKIRLIGEPTQIKTKHKPDGDQWIIDCEINNPMSKEDLSKLSLDDDSIEKRLKNNTRTWFINDTSYNHLIDDSVLGSDSEKWNGKDVELQILQQVRNQKAQDTIYAKGSV